MTRARKARQTRDVGKCATNGTKTAGGSALPKPGLQFVVPVRTRSTLNEREHWAVRARRAKIQRTATWLCAPLELRKSKWELWPVVVTLTRISPRQLDSGDNLPSALKAIRDEVATLLGIDDRDPRCAWVYEQAKGEPGQYAVQIRVASP